MAELSAYELNRAANIRRNNEHLMSLGILMDKEAMKPKPKPKAAPKPKPNPVASGPARQSARLDGQPAEDAGLDDDDGQPTESWSAPKKEERDPFRCWWTATKENPQGDVRPHLTESQWRALTTPLTPEERKSLQLDDDDEWVTDMLKFSRACIDAVARTRDKQRDADLVP
jgi:hypothetical protein